MTEIQEIILDRLMAADTIGEPWAPGPLRLILDTLRDTGVSDRTDICKALGFPLPFCAAIAGACETLPNVDAIRSFAVTLLTEIPPRSRLRRLDRLRMIDICNFCMRQAYLFHDTPNQLCDDVAALIDRFLTEETSPTLPAIYNLNNQLDARLLRIDLPPEADFHPEGLLLSVHFFALHAMRQASEKKSPLDNTGRVCRDTARLATLSGGLDRAITFCVDLARTMKL